MINKSFLVFLAFLFSVSAFSQHGRSGGMISGRVISTVEKEVVDFATVYLKGTNRGATTDEKGLYHLKAAAGDYTLVVSAIGYTTVEKKVTLKAGERIRVNVTIAPQVTELNEVVVSTSAVSRVNKSAFNAGQLMRKVCITVHKTFLMPWQKFRDSNFGKPEEWGRI